MIYWKLFYEFAKIGLFNFGGGMASIPFLQALSEKTGWFTLSQLTDFIAISESTPGPMAVNVATYAGYTTAGVTGGIVATFGLIFPALIFVTLIAKFMSLFKGNKYVDWAFYGLRPCVLALIFSAFLSIAKVTLFYDGLCFRNVFGSINFIACGIFVLIFVLLNTRRFRYFHPVAFLAFSAVLGILLF